MNKHIETILLILWHPSLWLGLLRSTINFCLKHSPTNSKKDSYTLYYTAFMYLILTLAIRLQDIKDLNRKRRTR